ncbi:transposase [Xanthomonas oryzae pv. oryzae PXO99A]|uniref:Transposase n=1 Tax=Xanthomonas oryzae pv. oryzae (strain PXO99A) TaxID=360094 RepID=A0A0K0GK70_XANOP|nr:transposase [Xanthomonas oryzae pv. oryzae PXO99A]
MERFNGRIADVLKTHRFNSREDMQQTLERYVALYNHQLPQSALGSKTRMQAMKQWHQERPDFFHKRAYDRPGCDKPPVSPGGYRHAAAHASSTRRCASAARRWSGAGRWNLSHAG